MWQTRRRARRDVERRCQRLGGSVRRTPAPGTWVSVPRQCHRRAVRVTTTMACVSFRRGAALAAGSDLGVSAANTAVLWVLTGLAVVLTAAAATAPSTFEGRGAMAFVVVGDGRHRGRRDRGVVDETLAIMGCSLFLFVGVFAGPARGRAAFIAHVVISASCLVVVAARPIPCGRTTILLSLATWLALGVPLAVRALCGVISARRARQLAFTDPTRARRICAGLERNFVSLRASRAGVGLAVAVVIADIDRFKTVNDVHGHAVGDAVIGEAARLLFDIRCRGDGCRPARRRGFHRLVAGDPGDLRYRVHALPTVPRASAAPGHESVGAAWCTTDAESTDALGVRTVRQTRRCTRRRPTAGTPASAGSDPQRFPPPRRGKPMRHDRTRTDTDLESGGGVTPGSTRPREGPRPGLSAPEPRCPPSAVHDRRRHDRPSWSCS